MTATGAPNISRCDAVAFDKPYKLSGIFTRNTSSSTYEYQDLPVAFIGDSGFTLDPILAQGAGLAVEDGWHLYEGLLKSP